LARKAFTCASAGAATRAKSRAFSFERLCACVDEIEAKVNARQPAQVIDKSNFNHLDVE
jgi:hypothetical protein